MAQFILIDHSMQDTTGHHYEYALRVLHAAESLGYTPVLGVNVDFMGEAPSGWQIHAVYRQGFWPRMARRTSSHYVVELAKKTVDALRLLHLRWLFSKWGLLYLNRDEPIGFLRRYPLDAPVGAPTLILLAAIYLPARIILRLLAALVPFRSYFLSAFTAIRELVRSMFFQVLQILSPSGVVADWKFGRRKRKSFGEDTLRFLQRLKLGTDDLVFVPTLSESEMLGLLECFRRHEPCREPSYHLVFRRNLYEGRESDFESQEGGLSPIRNAFIKFHSSLSGHRVVFYTDTEELSRQYNRLKIFLFRICPIPHTVPASEHKATSQPLRVTYLGDARTEKGYGQLPAIVQDLWQTEVETGRACFVLQSNYNVEPGEPEAIVARSQLRAYPSNKVHLLITSCSSDQYRDLLLSADVMLLPYREDQYYARSSGVLIESLAAGVPVVVPETSWLAKQIADPTYQYLSKLALSECAIPAKRQYWYCEFEDGIHRLSKSQGAIRIGGEHRKAYNWQPRPSGASYVLVGFQFGAQEGEFVTCYVDQVDEVGGRVNFQTGMRGPGYGERTAWIPVRLHPRTKRLWIGLRNAFSDSPITLHRTSIVFIGSPDNMAIPISVVGTMFSPRVPGAASAALQEVLLHYDHYRLTAREFSEFVYRRHNADNLVQTLLANQALSLS